MREYFFGVSLVGTHFFILKGNTQKMKKKNSIICIVIILLCCVGVGLILFFDSIHTEQNNNNENNETTFVEPTFWFDKDLDSGYMTELIFVEQMGTESHIVIPSVSPEGNTVEKIGAAFGGCKDRLTGVTIPKSVKIIGDGAFKGCVNLKTIIFEDESQLKEIGPNAFSECVSLETIEIPKSVTKIDASAFKGCKSLKKVLLTDEGANCEFWVGAFWDCEKLKQIYVPERVHLRDNVFDENLDWLLYGGTLEPLFDDVGIDYSQIKQGVSGATAEGIVWKASGEDKAYVFAYIGDKAELDLSKPIEGRNICIIEKGAFKSCETITKIVLPETVSVIGSQAFYGCKNLKEINIPSSIDEVSDQVFCGCSSLEKIELPANISVIGTSSFEDCTNLKTVTSAGGTSLEIGKFGAKAFKNCKNLEQISINLTNDSLTRIKQKLYGDTPGGLFGGSSIAIDIGVHAFEGCESLKSFSLNMPMVLTSSIVRIDFDAFAGCISLENVSIDRIETIGKRAFSGCESLKSVTGYNHQYKEIADSAFLGCKSLESLSNLNRVSVIGQYAFSGCSSFEEIELSSALEAIGSEAFNGCTSITDLSIPSSVTSFGENAFIGCTGIKKLSIGTNCVSVTAFEGCNIEELTVPAVWFDKDLNIQVSKKLTVTGSGNFSNSGHNRIDAESVIFSDGFTSIHYLYGSFKNVTIPSTLTKFSNDGAYDRTRSNTNVYYLGDVEDWCSIEFCSDDSNPLINGGKLYINNQEINILTIPDTVSKVNDYAFFGCASIKNINFTGDNLSIELGKEAFAKCSGLGDIFLPKGVYRVGETCFYMSSITGLEAESLPYIEDGAFEFCENLKFAKINKTIEIGRVAFEGCKNLETIEFESIQSIKSAAFYQCKSLKEVVLPLSIEYFESSVFSDGVQCVIFTGNLKWKYTTQQGVVNYVYAKEITLEMLNEIEYRKWERVYE